MKLIAVILLVGTFAVATDAPRLSDTQKLNIRNAQIEVQNVQLQMDQLQQQYTQLAQQKQASAQKLDAAIKAAFTDAKVKEEDYTLDGNLELVAKPKPPKPDAVPPKGTK